MKTTILSFIFCLFWISITAQTPQAFSYQTVVRDLSGKVLAKKPVTFRISILQGSTTGTAVYSEFQSKTTNDFGLVDMEIGKGTLLSGSFTGINWGSNTFFIKVEMDPTGGTAYQNIGTSQLLSVPYALYAKSSGNGFSGDYNDLTNKPVILNNALQTTATGHQALLSNSGTDGTATGYQALWSNTTGNDNTATGTFALKENSTGWGNTANGSMSLMKNTTGYRNTADGVVALPANTTGTDNTATGAYALYNNSIGWNNTANGARALYSNTDGNYNTSNGVEAGYSNTSGNYNVFLGYRAGYYETGSNKLFIDNQSRASESDAREKVLIYGEFDANPANQTLKINGKINASNHQIVNLADPVNEQDATTKAYVDNLFNQLISAGAITDADMNVYPVVKIGTQYWMAANLRTRKYYDGTDIPLVFDDTEWQNLTTPGYCWYEYNEGVYGSFGALYNWYAVNTGILCPKGWHVPSDDEWTILSTYLGGESVAGGKMKSVTGWDDPNTGATNESGFSGLPGGDRYAEGTFHLVGHFGGWWSSTELSADYVWGWSLIYSDAYGSRIGVGKGIGFSVRCLRDF
jgi:uncharacterized protein (TIGR02145 family)